MTGYRATSGEDCPSQHDAIIRSRVVEAEIDRQAASCATPMIVGHEATTSSDRRLIWRMTMTSPADSNDWMLQPKLRGVRNKPSPLAQLQCRDEKPDPDQRQRADHANMWAWPRNRRIAGSLRAALVAPGTAEVMIPP